MGCPGEHRVMSAKDTEVSCAACRPEVFVAGKAQSTGTPSVGQLHICLSCVLAPVIREELASGSGVWRRSPRAGLPKPEECTPLLHQAFILAARVHHGRRRPRGWTAWPRRLRGGGEDPRDVVSLLPPKACSCHRDPPTQEGRVCFVLHRK